MVLWRTGLRSAELTALLVRHVDREQLTIRVVQGKGKRPRTIPFDADTLTILDHWLTVRAIRKPTTQALFCTLDHGRPLDTSYLRKMLKRAKLRIGLKKRLYPHSFRHLYAVELDRERTPLHVISGLLGHARASTTSVYVNHMEPQEAIEAIAKRPPWLVDITG